MNMLATFATVAAPHAERDPKGELSPDEYGERVEALR